MKATKLSIPDVILFEPKVFGDDRGFFYESFNNREFEQATGLKRNFVQDIRCTKSIRMCYKTLFQ